MRTIYTRHDRLGVDLTDKEIMDASMDLAHTVEAIEAEVLRQTEIKAEMKATLHGLNKEQHRLSYMIVSKTATREVEVLVQIEGIVVQEVRIDTGEIMSTREATPSELQMPFPEEEDDGRA